MATARGGYYTKAGRRVPSVTTILSRFKDAGGLIHWANTIAYEAYREARAALETADELSARVLRQAVLAKPADHCDYRVARDTAASVGTIVHERVDCFIRGKAFDPAPWVSALIPDPLAASETGYTAFLEWAGSTSFTLAEGEMPLVSEEHAFGGTPDAVLVRGVECVGDWKSGDLYAEQVIPQLAAYRQLFRENGRAVADGAHAISINKKTGGFTHRYFTPDEMQAGWDAFVLMRELYDKVGWLKNTSKTA